MSDRAFFFYRGRVALYALLKAMGVAESDEVLLQAFTCLAVPSPILGIGARPIYVDIDPLSLNIDPVKIEEKITSKSKAIIVQHTFGVPADMDAILEIARKHNLYVIEDCCHCIKSSYQGHEVGSFGHAAFYSFEWGKPIVVGVGGCAVVNDARLAATMRSGYANFVAPSLRELAIINAEYFAHRYVLTPSLFWTVRDAYRFMSSRGLIVGSFRTEEFEGRVSPDYSKRMLDGLKRRLIRKLSDVDRHVLHMREVASHYLSMLNDLGYKPDDRNMKADPVYLRYPLTLDHKEKIVEAARLHRVEASAMFVSPVHPLQKEELNLVGYEPGSCPVAEAASRCVVSFPTHSKIGRKELEKTRRFFAQLIEDDLLHPASEVAVGA